MPREKKKRGPGRPKGSKNTKPSECLAIYVNFASRDERRALERVAAHYDLPRSVVIRRLIAEADKFLADGRVLKGVVEG
jgi:hypothetical protein